MRMLKRTGAAIAMAFGLAIAASQVASAADKKAIDCAKAENAKRSECAKAVGQSRENERTNKGAAATGADRSGAVHDMNAARENTGGGKKN